VRRREHRANNRVTAQAEGSSPTTNCSPAASNTPARGGVTSSGWLPRAAISGGAGLHAAGARVVAGGMEGSRSMRGRPWPCVDWKAGWSARWRN
jgi:hypothetical protein